MKWRHLRKRRKLRKASKNLDTALVPGLCHGSVPRLSMPVRAFERGIGGYVSERRVHEMTWDISFVHRSIEILSLCLGYEFTR